MAENENVLKPEEIAEEPVTENTPVAAEQPAPKPSKGKKAQKGIKEWFRKRIVALKRKPQNIAFAFLVISTVYFMLALFNISIAVNKVYTQEGIETTIGICIFITTLLSLLVLVSFLNSFPKRKKPNIFFIVLVFLMIGAMVVCDVMFYVQMSDILALPELATATDTIEKVTAGQTYVMVHVILLGISAIVFALLPAYRILINKINTKVELESATENMHGAIDIQED